MCWTELRLTGEISRRRELALVQTYVLLWGVAVGILTIRIIVPIPTTYSCVER